MRRGGRPTSVAFFRARRETEFARCRFAVGRVVLRGLIDRAWTDSDLARVAGCSSAVVGLILQGKIKLSLRMSLLIGAALDIPPADLLAAALKDLRVDDAVLLGVRRRAAALGAERAGWTGAGT